MVNAKPLSSEPRNVSVAGTIETRRVQDELEWHRWFAWYPVVVARDNERAYWAWLQFVERKTRQEQIHGRVDIRGIGWPRGVQSARTVNPEQTG